MQPWAWVLLIVALLVVVALALMATNRRRSTRLQERFGPEYDRTVAATDDRRAAEQELADRARRRDELTIRPLPAESRERYANRWREVQERFVDDPSGAFIAAHALLDAVMTERGYPTRDLEEKADLISVDHPQVVENYRAAHSVIGRHQQGQATTEDLRDGFVRYRSLFEELLRPDGTAQAADGTDHFPDDTRYVPDDTQYVDPQDTERPRHLDVPDTPSQERSR